MKKLISRWNREKAEAIERARVFDVEEREDRLILTKRLTPFLGEAIGGAVAGLLWVIASGLIFQSPSNRALGIGWITFWMMWGPIVAFFPVRQAWRVHRGDVWIFNRKSGQLEHNGLPMVSLNQLKSVLAHGSNQSDAGSSLRMKCQGAKDVFLDNQGKDEEHLQIGQQIADFLGVRFNPPYW